MAEPEDRFYESQGLRLQEADWGNATATSLVGIQGGLDHCRNGEAMARARQAHGQIGAPGRRGHGEAEWGEGTPTEGARETE